MSLIIYLVAEIMRMLIQAPFTFMLLAYKDNSIDILFFRFLNCEVPDKL